MPEQKKWESFLLILIKHLCEPAQVWETTWDSALEGASVKCVCFAAPWGKARLPPFWGTDAIPGGWKGKKDPRRTLKHQIRKREGGFSRPDLSARAAVTLLYLIFISDFDCSPSWTCPDSRPCWSCEYSDQFLHEWLLFLCSLLQRSPCTFGFSKALGI